MFGFSKKQDEESQKTQAHAYTETVAKRVLTALAEAEAKRAKLFQEIDEKVSSIRDGYASDIANLDYNIEEGLQWLEEFLKVNKLKKFEIEKLGKVAFRKTPAGLTKTNDFSLEKFVSIDAVKNNIDTYVKTKQEINISQIKKAYELGLLKADELAQAGIEEKPSDEKFYASYASLK